MPQNRRKFLASIGATALAAITARHAAAAGAANSLVHGAGAGTDAQQKQKLQRIGLQLYTIRSVIQSDVPGTLEKVAQAGYKEVEFAGYYNLPAAEIRNLLAKNGLTSPSTHMGLQSAPDAWKKAVDEARLIGHDFITVPSVPGGFDKASVDGWKQCADRFNKAAEVARAAGLRFAFHNHAAEFNAVQGSVPFDILIENTDPALVDFQIDIHWMVVGGRNILDYYAKYPTRFPMVHVKDRDPSLPAGRQMVDVGKGTIEWARIFPVSLSHGTRHFFVEHDTPADPIASMRASADYLSKLEF